MAIKISSGFQVRSVSPIDTRFVLSKAEMLAADDRLMPDNYFAVCSDDGKLYLYNKDLAPSATTGKFKLMDVNFGVAEDGQILIFNAQTETWQPANFVSSTGSIGYSAESGLEIRGFNTAAVNRYPYKDLNGNIAWKEPLDQSALNTAVRNATTAATEAANSATSSAGSSVQAQTAATQAELLNQNTVTYVNNKFWWGTLEEYNALTEINEGTFYFVQKEG